MMSEIRVCFKRRRFVKTALPALERERYGEIQKGWERQKIGKYEIELICVLRIGFPSI
jgi:hypothetical protein